MGKQIIVKNLLISYSENPGQSGRTLLFLHGWRSSKEVWNGVMGRLASWRADQLISSYAVDLPGFGSSEVPQQAMTVGDYSDVVAEFIRKLELKNVIIVSHSFGGRIGIKLTSAHPELISKLVLVDSAGFPMASSKKKFMGLAAKIVKPIFKPQMMLGLRKKIYKSLGAEDYVATPQLQQTLKNIVAEDLSADLENIRVPTLIVWGRSDRETPLRFGEKMYAIIKNSSLAILEHAGHFSFIDQPEKFVEVLEKFIEG